MDTREVLQQARALISDPARWTQEEYARNADGIKAYVWHADARAWCAIGAVRRVASDNDSAVLAGQRALAQPIETVELESEEAVTNFNDTHTHAEVLALFDAAIARLESAAAP
jgi:hypothetical protein